MGRKVNRRRKPEPGPENVAVRKAGLVLTVKRRDALIRQLDTAIERSFTGRDVLSIHLIAMSARRRLPVHAALFNRNTDVINLAANRKVLSLGAIEVVAQPSQRQSAEH